MLKRHVAAADINAVFALEAVFQHLKLKHADDADNDLLDAGIRLVENLYRALLRYLHDALLELLALHRIDALHSREMLRREGWNALEAGVHPFLAYRVAY